MTRYEVTVYRRSLVCLDQRSLRNPEPLRVPSMGPAHDSVALCRPFLISSLHTVGHLAGSVFYGFTSEKTQVTPACPTGVTDYSCLRPNLEEVFE